MTSLFEKRLALIPINEDARHWTLIAVRMQPFDIQSQQPARLLRIEYYDSCGGSGESYFPNILRLLQDVHKTQHKTELDVSEQYASARAHTPPLPPPAHAFSSPARSFSSAHHMPLPHCAGGAASRSAPGRRSSAGTMAPVSRRNEAGTPHRAMERSAAS